MGTLYRFRFFVKGWAAPSHWAHFAAFFAHVLLYRFIVKELTRIFRRKNEVLREHGAALERDWIGHSAKVMQEHYFQVTDEDFLKAAGKTSHAESHAQGREIATNVAIFH